MSPRSQFLGLALFIAATGAAHAQVSPADMNCDGAVNGLDIAPYVDCLLTANCPACVPQAIELPALLDCLLTGNCPTTVPEGMVSIPAGPFQMGDPFNEGNSDERPVHTVSVSAFYLGRYEVTNREYAEALNWAWGRGGVISVTNGVVYRAGGTSYLYCDTTTSDSHSRITWNGSAFGVTAGKEDHPMVRVSWYGSAAYCNWRSGMAGRQACYDLTTWTCDFTRNGYRLPTDAEWEKAARGRQYNPYRRYPWGDTLDGSKANYSQSGDPYETGPEPWTTPVGYYNGGQTPPGVDMANGYGLYDMSGNVWEWCNDWFSSTYYASSPSDNPRGPATGVSRVLRGGSWGDDVYGLRCANHGYFPPDYRNNYIGFRLALDSV